jgi:hypothetical protein
VELLIVMLVLAILAMIVIGAYTGSLELGKEARTRAQIAKIDALLAPIWESFRTRRVKLPPGAGAAGRGSVAALRLDHLREEMRMRLPDRMTDVTDPPVMLSQRPPLSQRYLTMATTLSGGNWTAQYQDSECLFLILANIQDGDTNGLEFFRNTEISDPNPWDADKKDLDGDGIPEILDGWGNPIRFLRWAPGFVSEKQNAFEETSGPQDVPATTVLNTTWISENPDPFDPLKVDVAAGRNTNTFYLYPLVISAGGDGFFDVAFGLQNFVSYKDTTPPNNPFHAGSGGEMIGKYVDEGPRDENNKSQPNNERNDGDNVHNHYVRTRIR